MNSTIEKNEFIRKKAAGTKANQSLTLSSGEFDDESMTVGLSFSSSEPYERWFGLEVLSHKRGAVNLSRLQNKANFLWNHDRDKVLGVIEEATTNEEKNRGEAVVRFRKDDEGRKHYELLKDGILSNVSFSYTIDEIKLDRASDDGLDTYLVTRYTPLEISLVSVPADYSVGFGRSLNDLEDEFTTYLRNEGDVMARNVEGGTNEGQGVKPSPVLPKTEESAPNKDDHIKMMKTANSYGMSDLGIRFIEEGRSLVELQEAILSSISSKQIEPIERPLSEQDIGLSKKEARQYSILRALRCVSEPNYNSFEREVTEEVQKRYGARNEPGVAIPPEVLRINRSLRGSYQRDNLSVNAGTGNNPQGDSTVETNIEWGSFAQIQRSKMVVLDAGVRMLSDLEGNVSIVRQTEGAQAAWTVEGTEAAGSNIKTDAINLRPKRLTTFIDITRTFIRQLSIDAEQMVISDLTDAVATAVQQAIFNGSGTGEEPLGLNNRSTIEKENKAVSAIEYADVVAMETFIEENNLMPDSASYIASPQVKGALKSKPIFTNSSVPIWNGNEVNGRSAYSTSAVTGGLIFYGLWSEVIIGEWGPLWIQENPYLKATSGVVRIDIERLMDINVRREKAFKILGTQPTGSQTRASRRAPSNEP